MRARLGTAAHLCEVILKPYTPNPERSTLDSGGEDPADRPLLPRVHLPVPPNPETQGYLAHKKPGARPAHQIITMLKWIRTSRLSITLSVGAQAQPDGEQGRGRGGRLSAVSYERGTPLYCTREGVFLISEVPLYCTGGRLSAPRRVVPRWALPS